MTISALAAPLTRRRARLARYTLWHARDFAWNIAIVGLLLFGLVGWLMHLSLDAEATVMEARHLTLPKTAQLNLFQQLLSMFVTVGPILVLTGIVSNDRTHGYTRFLFSKPLSPVAYYAQVLVVRFVGFLAMGAVLLLAWSHYHDPQVSWKFFADIICCFVSIGGVVFLTSVLTRFDSIVAIIFLLVSAAFYGKWEALTGFKHYLTWPLSPVSKFGELHMWFLGINNFGALVDLPFPTKWFIWNMAYGLACVLLGLVMLRRIPLTKA
jgi:preprotein translocase subunit Sss1